MDPTRKIKIIFNGAEKNIIVDKNKVTKTTIADTFGVSKGNLSCMLNGEDCYVMTDEQNFYLNDKIHEYSLTSTDSSKEHKFFFTL